MQEMREKEDGLGNGTSATHAAWFDVRFRAPLRHQCMAKRMSPTDPKRTHPSSPRQSNGRLVTEFSLERRFG